MMIQDIEPYHLDNQYRPVPPDGDGYAMYYEEHAVLARRTESGIEFPRFRELERLNDDVYGDAVYLFSVNEERYYLVREINREPLSEFTMENTEIFRRALPRHHAFAGITGYQLYNWYRSRRYCGRCGSLMELSDKERMMHCDACGNMEYPKICLWLRMHWMRLKRLLLWKKRRRSPL